MGEVRGFGVTHYPPMLGTDRTIISTLQRNLRDPELPPKMKDPANWPELMQKEWAAFVEPDFPSAAAHREHLVRNLKIVREALDDFNPDIVVMFGDDQWELFHEEFVPTFCVLCFNDEVVKPFGFKSPYTPDVWGEGPEHERTLHMDRNVGRFFSNELIKRDFDVSYAYRPREGAKFPHAFLNAVLLLDYERKGFPYTLLPISINCHGRRFVAAHGSSVMTVEQEKKAEYDPTTLTPDRLMQLGAAVARIAEDSQYKVAIIASSGWSHASLNYKASKLWPDVASDRRLYEAMMSQDYKYIRDLTDDDIDGAGEQEARNWFCLAGAMEELDSKPTFHDFVETNLFNSNKIFAVYE